MGYYSSTETEDITFQEYDEKTGAPNIIVRLPKWKLTPAEKMQVYLTSLGVLRKTAEDRRRECIRQGDGGNYLKIDAIEKEEQDKLFRHFFPSVE